MVAQIPFGRLASGQLGILVDPTTGKPQSAVVEVLSGLPASNAPDNFTGRCVYDTSTNTVYTFSSTPSPAWTSIAGSPVTVGAVAGSPPVSPVPATGSLYYDTDTKGLFCWDGLTWNVVGGQYGGQMVSYSGTGDGATTTLPMGLSVGTTTPNVEVFLDGIRQTPATDYNVAGSNVVMTTAPALNVKIVARALQITSLAQSAVITQVSYTGNGATVNYNTGQAGVNPNGIFVFVNGALKTYGIDYTVLQDNTQISAIAHTASANSATATTVASAHGLSPGNPITIQGTNSIYANIATTVATTPLANTFTFPINTAAPSPSIVAAAGKVMSFLPAAHVDQVHFSVAPLNGAAILILVLQNVVVAPSAGEANVGFNLEADSGSTVAGVYAGKSGINLNFKSLKAGAGISLDRGSDSNAITIISTSGMAQHVYAQVTGGGGTWDYNSNAPTATLVAVQNSALNWTIQLPTPGSPISGKRIVVKDESGAAGSHNIAITVAGGGAQLEGSTSMTISTNYGSFTLYCNGAQWLIEH